MFFFRKHTIILKFSIPRFYGLFHQLFSSKNHFLKNYQNIFKKVLTNRKPFVIIINVVGNGNSQMGAQLSWESICLTSRGSQVRALLFPPKNPRTLFSDFFIQSSGLEYQRDAVVCIIKAVSRLCISPRDSVYFPAPL